MHQIVEFCLELQLVLILGLSSHKDTILLIIISTNTSKLIIVPLERLVEPIEEAC